MNQQTSVNRKLIHIAKWLFILTFSVNVHASDIDVLKKLRSTTEVQHVIDNALINGFKVSVIQLIVENNMDATTEELIEHFRPVNEVIFDHDEWPLRKINWFSERQSYMVVIGQQSDHRTHALLTVLEWGSDQSDDYRLKHPVDSKEMDKLLLMVESNYSKAFIHFRDHAHIVVFGNAITLAGAYRAFAALLSKDGWLTNDGSGCLSHASQYCNQTWTKKKTILKLSHQHHHGQTFTFFMLTDW